MVDIEREKESPISLWVMAPPWRRGRNTKRSEYGSERMKAGHTVEKDTAGDVVMNTRGGMFGPL